MTRQVDIWLFALDRTAAECAAFEPWLSPDERERRTRFIHARDRDRFTATRGVVRHILGARTDRPPESLAFVRNAYGKPALKGEGQPCFNLSHSGAIGALGVGGAVSFGVDIEKIAPIEAAVADISFSPAERAELAACPPEEWLASFYRCWTRKEAVIKALGLGLAQPLDAFDVTLGPQAPARLLRLDGAPQAPATWELFHFVPARGYMGAVAVSAPGHSIVLRRWMPSAA